MSNGDVGCCGEAGHSCGNRFIVPEPGDVVELGIEGLGVQRQKIVPFKA